MFKKRFSMMTVLVACLCAIVGYAWSYILQYGAHYR